MQAGLFAFQRKEIEMRLSSRALVCALLIACCSPLALAAAPGSFCAAASQPGQAPAFDPSRLGSPEKPIAMTGPCSVSRNCDHPPPYSISCSGAYSNSTCSSGADGYGWVLCDGNYTECPPPPPTCTG